MLLQEKTKQIGTVAKETGVPIKTIRYYEELGLLKASGRTEGGFRLFSFRMGSGDRQLRTKNLPNYSKRLIQIDLQTVFNCSLYYVIATAIENVATKMLCLTNIAFRSMLIVAFHAAKSELPTHHFKISFMSNGFLLFVDGKEKV